MQAGLYDLGMKPFEKMGLRDLRHRLVSQAHGRTLEIGVGTGLNFPHYSSDARVTAIDPDENLLARARSRSGTIEIVNGDAQAMPFADGSFDSVVATLVLCTIPDPKRALAEVRRILAPGGKLFLLEHVRMPSRTAALFQDALTPLWKHLAGGCHLNRDPEKDLAHLGFITESHEILWRGLGKLWILRRPQS